jgi:arabinan endo-1,5-alpha-L-arabinosidase
VRLSGRLLAVLIAAGATLAASTAMSEAAGYPLPVKTTTGLNYDMPDPGVLLSGSTFYGFFTGGGLRESTSGTAAGPWSAPVNELRMSTLPSWVDASKGIWAPDMIKTTSGEYVVYFSAALPGTAGHPAGNDAKPASGARCVGTAESKSPTGPFSANPKPLVCLENHGAADDMKGDPGNRVRGEGVVDPSPAVVTIGGHAELFLLYKTQGNPADGQIATIRMVHLNDSDGTSVLGESHQLLHSSTGSFADTIEAPALIQDGSYFTLFVAHGNFDSCGYSTQWFRSQHIWAWTNGGGSTWLSAGNTGLCGPGGADVSVSRVPGQDRIFFHGWVKESKGVISTVPLPSNVAPDEGVNAARVMYAAVLTFTGSGAPILGPYQGQS